MTQRIQVLFLILLMVVSDVFVSSIHGRKLLTDGQKDRELSSLDDRLYLTALPKGTVPASTPSRKGHASTIDQKLIARHLAAIDRILRSVPSPGVGH